MKWTLQIALDESEPDLPRRTLFKPALDLLNQRFQLQDTGLCLRIVSLEESQHLNQQFRGKNHPTNVLSFPFDEADYLGDLVFCHSLIATEAMAQHKTLKAHYQHLLIHGVLHLLGYDHETENEALEMESIEIELLATLDIANPYETDHD